MGIRLDDEARRYLGMFTDQTGATAVDCIRTDDAVVFVVPPADMSTAIGPGGRTVRALEDQLDQDVVIVEDAERPEDFVAHTLAPAAVYDVTVTDGTATAMVDPADVGVAIGEDGTRIARARELVARHFDIDDIQIAEATSPH